MLHDVHGEVYGGVEHGQPTVYWADTKDGTWRSGRRRGDGRVWDMKSREKALDDGEDAFPVGDHCTIDVRGYGTQQRACKTFKSMKPRNALLEYLRLSLGGRLLCKSYVY